MPPAVPMDTRRSKLILDVSRLELGRCATQLADCRSEEAKTQDELARLESAELELAQAVPRAFCQGLAPAWALELEAARTQELQEKREAMGQEKTTLTERCEQRRSARQRAEDQLAHSLAKQDVIRRRLCDESDE